MMKATDFRSRFMATIYGQAIGDALGLGTEFMTKEAVTMAYPGGLSRYDEIHGCHDEIAHGDWSDDTDMMLCIAESIIDQKGEIDQKDIAKKFLSWAGSSRATSIGRLTARVVFAAQFVKSPEEVARSAWEAGRCDSAPNGGLMRTAVVGLLQRHVAESAEKVCRVTHYDPRCVGSCVIASEIIHHLVYNGRELAEQDIIGMARNYDERIVDCVKLSRSTDISALQLGAVAGRGYTLKCLSALLWCYFNAKSFEHGLLAVVNEGGDADTNAAPACAVLGAKFGLEAIPHDYIEHLAHRDEIETMGSRLLATVGKP